MEGTQRMEINLIVMIHYLIKEFTIDEAVYSNRAD